MSQERKPNIQDFDYRRYQILSERIFGMIGHLPPEYKSKICTDVLVPHANKSLGLLDNIPRVEEWLTDMKSSYQEKGFNPSSPRISARLLELQAMTFIESLEEPLLAGHVSTQDLMKFSIYYDFATGIQYTANAVRMAEESIRGNSEFDLIDKVDDPDLPTDQIDKVEAALLLKSITRHATDLLKSDSTGHLLIRSTVQSLENGSAFIPDFITREFNIEGAKYAQRAYGIVYPIAERINKK